MNFFMQHGYGKSQKIQNVAAGGYLSGVVLSAADEDEPTLSSTIELCSGLGIEVRIDPQTYVYTTAPRGRGRNHENHGIEFGGLRWSQDAKATAHQVRAIGKLNERMNPDGMWIAPSVLQSSFADVWTPLALQFARTASDSWGPERTIATLVIDESALETWSSIDDWLDVATTLNVKGFYILVARSQTKYPPVAWSHERLSNLLRLIYNLSHFNGYEVNWGYSDNEGLLGLAAGATAMSSGWSYTLRQFNPFKWQPSESKGGNPPIARYQVSKIWSPLRAATEALDLFNSALQSDIFTSEQISDLALKPLDKLARADVQEQHMLVLAKRAAELTSVPISKRLDLVANSLENALTLFGKVEDALVILEAPYKPRVESLLAVLESFRSSEGV